MSEGDVARARAALAAFGTGDLDHLVRQFHPDFVGVVPPELSAEPDTYRGHAGIRRYLVRDRRRGACRLSPRAVSGA
jgi:ketosteroid isomerase-like protein